MSRFYQLRSPFTGMWLKIRGGNGEIVDGSEHAWPGVPHAADMPWERPRDETGRFLDRMVPLSFTAVPRLAA